MTNWRTIAPIAMSLFLVAVTGCGTTSSESADGRGDASGSVNVADSARTEPANRRVQVAAGTVVAIQFNDVVSTESSAPGDPFVATVVDPVYVGEAVAIDRGATVRGNVVEVKSGKKIGGRAKLTLEFTTLELPGGEQSPLDAAFYSEGKSQAGKDAATIGGATVGGAILGRIIGHQSDEDDQGTVIGAIVGAGIGTAIAASNDGQPVTIPAGTELSIRLDSPVSVTI